MRLFLFLSAMLFSFHYQASAQTDTKTQEIIVKTAIFCNHCDHCESCKPQIETALFQLSGVKQAKLNIAEQTVRVVYNPKKTSPEAIKQTILNSGYAADGTLPPAEAYAKLDGCCKRK